MIYIVNGAPGAGKTTFETNVQKCMSNSFCYILSTVDFVKEIAKKCGWNGEKDLKNRKFLSDLKDLLTNWNNVPFNKIVQQVKSIEDEWKYYDIDLNTTAIFIDCREPEEIQKLCVALNAKSLLITRADAENNSTSNHADQDVLNYNYDIIIQNNGDLREFAYAAIDFIDEQGLKFQSKPISVNLFGEIC